VAPNWSPYTSNIFIHGNDYKRSLKLPDLSKEFGQLISVYNAHGKGKTQDIIYDGFWDKSLSQDIKTNPMSVCIKEENMANLHFTLFDLWEGEDNIKSYKDYSPFECQTIIQTDVSAISNR
jgi:hypothetical protein